MKHSGARICGFSTTHVNMMEDNTLKKTPLFNHCFNCYFWAGRHNFCNAQIRDFRDWTGSLVSECRSEMWQALPCHHDLFFFFFFFSSHVAADDRLWARGKGGKSRDYADRHLVNLWEPLQRYLMRRGLMLQTKGSIQTPVLPALHADSHYNPRSMHFFVQMTTPVDR